MSEPDDNGSGGSSPSRAGGGASSIAPEPNRTVFNKPAYPTDMSLPSEHIDHANVLTNEMNIRLSQFEAGIAALEGERNGQIETFNREEAERKTIHTTKIADLDRRIEDLKRGKRMLAAALGEGERK